MCFQVNTDILIIIQLKVNCLSTFKSGLCNRADKKPTKVMDKTLQWRGRNVGKDDVFQIHCSIQYRVFLISFKKLDLK